MALRSQAEQNQTWSLVKTYQERRCCTQTLFESMSTFLVIILTQDWVKMPVKVLRMPMQTSGPRLTNARYLSRSGSMGLRHRSITFLQVTARCLESLIRLSTAHAKVRLSRVVEEEDCILRVALYLYDWLVVGVELTMKEWWMHSIGWVQEQGYRRWW